MNPAAVTADNATSTYELILNNLVTIVMMYANETTFSSDGDDVATLCYNAVMSFVSGTHDMSLSRQMTSNLVTLVNYVTKPSMLTGSMARLQQLSSYRCV
jgi:hypothetical protein